MHDYKYLRIAVMICATLLNTQVHTQLLTSYTISSASSAKNHLFLLVDDGHLVETPVQGHTPIVPKWLKSINCITACLR